MQLPSKNLYVFMLKVVKHIYANNRQLSTSFCSYFTKQKANKKFTKHRHFKFIHFGINGEPDTKNANT